MERHIMNNVQRGFTLIEVLVAATILFLVVTTAMTSFQTALSGSNKAASYLEMVKYTQPVKEQIKEELSNAVRQLPESTYSGEVILDNTRFSWQAELAESASPPSRFDMSLDGDAEYKPRFFLYTVKLAISNQSSKDTFTYDELVWIDATEPEDV